MVSTPNVQRFARNAAAFAVVAVSWVLFHIDEKSARAEARREHAEHVYPQPAVVGGGIDGPDGLKGLPKDLSWQDTSPAWTLDAQKLLITGVVYQPDARTPAPGVVLYYYHTNPEGRYVHTPVEPRSMAPNSLGQTHGSIRGWVKTGADGRYEIRTTRPGVYPTRDEPAHVHVTIKEPGIDAYYIDDLVFDDDPLLTSAKRVSSEKRCGSGVLRLVKHGDLFVGERDVYLGQNIPGHVAEAGRTRSSGPRIGEDVVSFTPTHAWGPDKGTTTCPVCKYGWYHGVLYFVGARSDWDEIKAWLRFFETESAARPDRLKVYLVLGDPAESSKDARVRRLESIGRELDLKHVALTFVPSFTDKPSDVVLNRIDPSAGTTMVVYRRSRVIDSAVDLKPSEANFARVRDVLARTRNEYFDIPKQ
jgi:protocatechuate 3,4-dioxygenase, beta subunit